MEPNQVQPDPQKVTPAQIIVNEQKLNNYISMLKLDQNLSFGVMAGLAASILGAALWAFITVMSGYQIGYMAIGIGFLVGFTIRKVGKGFDKVFGIAGAALSLFGCLLGNYLSMVAFYSSEQGISFFEVLPAIEASAIPDVMIASFAPMDLLFYGLAVYFGYKFSFRQLTEQEIMEHAVDK